MNFHSPQAFILLLLIPVYLYFNSKVVTTKGIPYPYLSFLPSRKMGFKAQLYNLILPLRLLILLLLVLTLARPQYGYEVKQEKTKGIDIMLTVDTSKSMLAEDLLPKNRIEAAKEVITNFVKAQNNNRIGLVIFSGKSFTLSPLTFDYDIILSLLKEITVDSVKIDGTAIGEAISNAIYRFSYDRQRSKVIILLTDGENNAGQIEPKKAAEIAKLKKVKIYTIGVGKTEGAPIPLFNPVTGEKDYARDMTGSVLLTKINENELIDISTKTGGAYFRAIDTNSLDKIYKKINALEKTDIVSSTYKVYQEKFYIFLLIALCLILLDFLLSKIILNPVRA